jgi:hypothetical protein
MTNWTHLMIINESPGARSERFQILGRYNAEKARGIAHIPEWDARMAKIQQEFNEWKRRS